MQRLFKREAKDVQVTLVESDKILGSFDTRLQAFAEKKISKRDRFQLVQSSVTGEAILLELQIYSYNFF